MLAKTPCANTDLVPDAANVAAVRRGHVVMPRRHLGGMSGGRRSLRNVRLRRRARSGAQGVMIFVRQRGRCRDEQKQGGNLEQYSGRH